MPPARQMTLDELADWTIMTHLTNVRLPLTWEEAQPVLAEFFAMFEPRPFAQQINGTWPKPT